MRFPDSFCHFIRNNTLIEIKGGIERENFLPIWIVEANDRLFVRTWNKSPKSWFTDFIKTGVGQIKYGDQIMKVKGQKLPKEDKINRLINEAYLNKYNQERNIKYAVGISQPEYADYTMELFFDRTEQ
ncbi:DUF2255 family protein [Carboxylicivirga sp. N1Y90]|uniref:DUF2255 family protein n=1 Tax=Carboxylicivirga fragile TaxID=3417571 RepID=UPI003D33E284|nr:DUF2255 family protein [Marinilabiliaceae bacterium N1Y90]